MGRLTIRSKVALWLLVMAVALVWPMAPGQVRAEDDHGDFRFAATALEIHVGAIAGAIQETNFDIDLDYFAFETSRGVHYTITLEALTIQGADFSIINSVPRGPGSSPGQIESQEGNQKKVEWIARTTDTYFIEVFGTQNGPEQPVSLGTYTLAVEADTSLEDRHGDERNGATPVVVGNLYPGAISPWSNQPAYTGTAHGGDDRDYFFFQADRGVTYTISAEEGTAKGVAITVEGLTGQVETSNDGIGTSLEWTASSGGTYYIIVTGSSRVREPVGTYTLKVVGDAALQDHHSGTPEGASPISFGNANRGAVSPADDLDYFSFQAHKGVRYTFQVDFGSDQAVGISVRDPEDQTEASNAGVGDALEWIASTNGTFFIAVAASPQVRNPTGAYALMVNADNSLMDRLGDTIEDPTAISLGTSYQAALSPEDDYDYFTLSAQRGVRYTFELTYGMAEAVSLSVSRPGGGAGTSAKNYGDGSDVVWIAPDNETYFVAVSRSYGVPDPVGTYSLSVGGESSLEDRHSDTTDFATLINYGTLYQGAISPADDYDYFFFTAEEGVEYQIQVDLDTAQAVRFSLTDLEGSFIDSNYGAGTTLTWTAPASVNYILEISGSAQVEDPVGTYRVSVTHDEVSPLATPSEAPIDLPEPLPALIPTSTVLSVANRTAPTAVNVRVPILIDLAEEIGRLDFSLSYDPAVAEATNVLPGSLFSNATLTADIDVPGVLSFGFIFEEGISGDGSVAVVEFRVVGDQGISSPLTLSETQVSDAAGLLQSIQLADGALTVDQRTPGDGNGDSKITALDSLLALRMHAGLADQDLVMDLDGDGLVTAEDARQILTMAAVPWET